MNFQFWFAEHLAFRISYFKDLQCFFSKFLAPLTMIVDPKVNQPAITCSKLTIETLEQGVKYVQS